jgi:hypothetical protein
MRNNNAATTDAANGLPQTQQQNGVMHSKRAQRADLPDNPHPHCVPVETKRHHSRTDGTRRIEAGVGDRAEREHADAEREADRQVRAVAVPGDGGHQNRQDEEERADELGRQRLLPARGKRLRRVLRKDAARQRRRHTGASVSRLRRRRDNEHSNATGANATNHLRNHIENARLPRRLARENERERHSRIEVPARHVTKRAS